MKPEFYSGRMLQMNWLKCLLRHIASVRGSAAIQPESGGSRHAKDIAQPTREAGRNVGCTFLTNTNCVG